MRIDKIDKKMAKGVRKKRRLERFLKKMGFYNDGNAIFTEEEEDLYEPIEYFPFREDELIDVICYLNRLDAFSLTHRVFDLMHPDGPFPYYAMNHSRLYEVWGKSGFLDNVDITRNFDIGVYTIWWESSIRPGRALVKYVPADQAYCDYEGVKRILDAQVWLYF